MLKLRIPSHIIAKYLLKLTFHPTEEPMETESSPAVPMETKSDPPLAASVAEAEAAPE